MSTCLLELLNGTLVDATALVDQVTGLKEESQQIVLFDVYGARLPSAPALLLDVNPERRIRKNERWRMRKWGCHDAYRRGLARVDVAEGKMSVRLAKY